MGLVAKAKNRHVAFGNAWEDVMGMARRLWNTFGDEGEPDETQLIETLWEDPQTRNEKAHLEGLGLKREKLGVPLEQLWSEAGYTPEQIERMKAMDEYQARQAQYDLALQGLGALEGGRG
jgi:hypothetical protein